LVGGDREREPRPGEPDYIYTSYGYKQQAILMQRRLSKGKVNILRDRHELLVTGRCRSVCREEWYLEKL
jgi:hypothetical protein